jgi:hypothetical protein
MPIFQWEKGKRQKILFEKKEGGWVEFLLYNRSEKK